jgi:hypothetical protein
MRSGAVLNAQIGGAAGRDGASGPPMSFAAMRELAGDIIEFGMHSHRREIAFAARIGSQINALPPKDVYELKRTAVRGTDTFWEFKTKLRKGRIKLF